LEGAVSSDILRTARWKNLCARLKATRPPICWWCGEAIDLSLSGRSPMGWTLDHTIPRFVAPHLTWDESNLQPAHHNCNSTRGGQPQPVQTSRKWS